MIGRRFGRLVILSDAEPYVSPGGYWDRRYRVACDCGAEKVVRGASLRNGLTNSCGCYNREMIARSDTKWSIHKESRPPSPEFRTWVSMLTRCENPNDHTFANYGGRGIKICERWRSSYENFLADMGRKPSPLHSIDRINNDGDYEPNNCRWATAKQQANNRRPPRRRKAA